jgi:hypothetical protein
VALTLISHFWNEEFLLPYWLRHHVPLFDHGILFDYASTDRSMEIVREMAPHWEVRPSINEWFDAGAADAEVMAAEREQPGWKMVLNTTELVLCPDLALLVRWLEKYRPDIQGVWGFDLVLVDRLGERDAAVTAAPLHLQRHWGYHAGGERSRLLHRAPDGRYHVGRHKSDLVAKVPDDRFFVLWLGWSPMRYIRGRKLQIQQRIPPSNRALGLGSQHLVTAQGLEAAYQQEAAKAYDLLERHAPYRELVQGMAANAGLALDLAADEAVSKPPAVGG